jgi:HD-GYP domain-containing protein (c-di-GMP phosphodiesterase class II)
VKESALTFQPVALPAEFYMNQKLKKFFPRIADRAAFFRETFSVLHKIILLAVVVFVTTIFVQNSSRWQTLDSDDKPFPVRFSIFPRMDEGDLWDAYFPEISSIRPGRGNFIGAVYEASVENLSDENLADWKIELRVKQNCYLNNAWNGTVEIFQKKNGAEKKQIPVDLNESGEKNISIPHIKTQENLTLIPLSPGDRIVFRPTSSIFIPAKSHAIGRAKIGFIFYTEKNFPLMKFDDWEISYKFKNDFLHNPLFYLSVIFYAMIFVYVILSARSKILRLEKEHDNQIIEQTMRILAKFIDAKDLVTGGHSERVAKCSRLIAKEMKKSKDFCREIFYCGLLHDCGKIAVPDEIIKKPSSLTEEEYTTIKNHTVYGGEMLKELTSIPHASEVALQHHEHFDGSGYPHGLKGEEISEFSRIVSVADSFDTMSNNRYYRKAFSREKIISELKENSGKQFDPAAVKILLNLIDKGKIKI